MTRLTLAAVATLALNGFLMNSASAGGLSFSFGPQNSCRDGNCQSSPLGSLNLGPLSLSFGQQSSCNGGNCGTPGLPMARPACPTSSCGTARTPGCSTSAPQTCGPQGCTPQQPTVYGRPSIRPRAAFTTPSGMPMNSRTRR
ncbi:MAG: hypothetical protein JNG89_01460 [Planctomycetaceae bacterium]|nr:hypothetical protein [Planctomycetaceae bacterium]